MGESRKRAQEIIADNLRQSPLELTIWIADAHRDNGKRFVVRADELLTAFLELESAIWGRKELS